MDENLEKQKFNFSDFLNKNKKKLIIFSVFIIICIFSGIAINEFKKKRVIKISENFNSAKIFIETEKKSKARNILLSIIDEKNNFYSPSALNLIIEHKLIDDKKKVLNLFDQVIYKSKLDKEMQNLFIIKKTFYLGDDISENILLDSLNPIIKSNSIWKKTALDYVQKYYISKNQFEKAKQFGANLN